MMKFVPVLVAVFLLTSFSPAPAQEYPIFGSRSLAMGRSGVASVIDASAVFTNPAALARNDFFKMSIPMVGIGAFSPVDVEETEDIVDNIASIFQKGTWNVADAQQLVTEIRRLDDDLVLGAEGHGLVAFKLPVPANLTLSISSRAVADVYVFADKANLSTVISLPLPPDSVINNTTRGLGHALWLNQVGLSAALPLPIFGENILVGATGLVGHATTYHLSETLKNLALTYGGTIDWEKRLRDNKETSYFVDLVVGSQVQLFDRQLTLGITANHLLSPSLDRKNRGNMTLDPQVRVGVAFSPYYQENFGDPEEVKEGEKPKQGPRFRSEILAESNPLTFTFDLDVTENRSALPEGIDSQFIGGGVEYAPASWVALRAGVYGNMSKSDLGQTITAGVQLSFLELALGWSTRRESKYANDVRAELGFDLTF